jgi:hypothetical protein
MTVATTARTRVFLKIACPSSTCVLVTTSQENTAGQTVTLKDAAVKGIGKNDGG